MSSQGALEQTHALTLTIHHQDASHFLLHRIVLSPLPTVVGVAGVAGVAGMSLVLLLDVVQIFGLKGL
jgi:hypothetical protein